MATDAGIHESRGEHVSLGGEAAQRVARARPGHWPGTGRPLHGSAPSSVTHAGPLNEAPRQPCAVLLCLHVACGGWQLSQRCYESPLSQRPSLLAA